MNQLCYDDRLIFCRLPKRAEQIIVLFALFKRLLQSEDECPFHIESDPIYFAGCSAAVLLLVLAAQHGRLDPACLRRRRRRGHQRGHLAAARSQGQTLRALRAGET